MIVSFIEGRIRLRHEILKRPYAAEKIKKIFLSMKGVMDISMNHKTGGMLIIYDSGVLDIKDISRRLALLMDLRADDKKGFVYPRKTVNAGMLASLIISLLGAATGKTALHIAAGIVFAGFAGAHTYKYRQMLFA
ncbi:HMA2 domain-containing protein [Dissulfurispira sp.]|uniref:HMA2 domain-containing protein n=1 Tax=Dissulfurispira sp. TaxID=2817609 RepID=UPI002FD88EA4